MLGGDGLIGAVLAVVPRAPEIVVVAVIEQGGGFVAAAGGGHGLRGDVGEALGGDPGAAEPAGVFLVREGCGVGEAQSAGRRAGREDPDGVFVARDFVVGDCG